MKRSKSFLLANILATLYTAYLLWTIGGAVVEAGGAEYVEAIRTYFELVFDILGLDSPAVTLLYTLLILICVHIAAFAVGCLIGWIAYARKKSGGAKFAATLYLLGAICFPVYLLFGLPIAIIGFVGGSKQKKINDSATLL